MRPTVEQPKMQVWATADTPKEAQIAIKYGAEGGFCKIGNVFLKNRYLPIAQRMILGLADHGGPETQTNFQQILEGNIKEVLGVMEGSPIGIELFDGPLQNFIPARNELLMEIKRLEWTDPDSAELPKRRQLLRMVENFTEKNPMMGLRGARLGEMYPLFPQMQVAAFIGAVVQSQQEGINSNPKIMIPFVINAEELRLAKDLVEETAQKEMEKRGTQVDYGFGVVIETSVAALNAEQLAPLVDFFLIDPRALTATTFAIDPEHRFLREYVRRKILPFNPFKRLDYDGVGKLMRMAVEGGRGEKPDLEIGVYGDYAADPNSSKFFREIGVDYVSVSPSRVPEVMQAATQ